MGWSFSFGNRTKSDMVEHLRRPGRFAANYKLARSTIVGNHHWYLLLNTNDSTVSIGLDLMAGGGIGQGWGHKPMCEADGPNELDCPLIFLKLADAPTGFAVAWREQVRQFHAKKADRSKPSEGRVVVYGKCAYRLEAPAGRGRGWNVKRVSDDLPFRMNRNQLAKASDE